jgi:hypothetical protein
VLQKDNYDAMINDLKTQIQDLKKRSNALRPPNATLASNKLKVASPSSYPKQKSLPPLPSAKAAALSSANQIGRRSSSIELPPITIQTRPMTVGAPAPEHGVVKKRAEDPEPRDIVWLRGTLWQMYGKRIEVRRQQQRIQLDLNSSSYLCQCHKLAITK